MKASKETLKNILKWKPTTKAVAIVAMTVLALLLIPLVRVAFYSVPWYDDYGYAQYVKNFLVQEASFSSMWEGLMYCVKTQWYAWQGTYSSMFFMALMPGLWGDDKYFIGPLLLIALLLVAIFVFVKVVIRDVLHADWASCVALQAITAIMVIELIHVPQHGFYWYNAGIHYVGMHSVLLFWLAMSIRLIQTKRLPARIVLAAGTVLGASIVAGSNYVTSLQGILLMLSIVGVACVIYKKDSVRLLWLLPSLAMYLFGFYKNVSAPGNQVRAGHYVGWGLSPVQAVLQSFVEAANNLGEFTGWITIAIMVLIAPVIWQMVGKLSFTFRMPGLLLLWSVCLYATGFTPSLYSMGNEGLARTLNAVKITYQLLLLANEIYWLGWLRKALEKKEKAVASGKIGWWFYPVMGVLMLGIFLVDTDRTGTYSSWAAYYYIHNGECYNFYHQYLDRVEKIKTGGSTVEITPYTWRPWIVCMGDLEEDPNSEPNRFMAQWYGKEAIICKPE